MSINTSSWALQSLRINVCAMPSSPDGTGEIILTWSVAGEPATGTARMIGAGRVWSVEADVLRAYADAHPEVRQILDHGFTLSLAEKLDAMNRADAAA